MPSAGQSTSDFSTVAYPNARCSAKTKCDSTSRVKPPSARSASQRPAPACQARGHSLEARPRSRPRAACRAHPRRALPRPRPCPPMRRARSSPLRDALALDADEVARASSKLTESGFSQKTGLPASNATFACARWNRAARRCRRNRRRATHEVLDARCEAHARHVEPRRIGIPRGDRLDALVFDQAREHASPLHAESDDAESELHAAKVYRTVDRASCHDGVNSRPESAPMDSALRSSGLGRHFDLTPLEVLEERLVEVRGAPTGLARFLIDNGYDYAFAAVSLALSDGGHAASSAARAALERSPEPRRLPRGPLPAAALRRARPAGARGPAPAAAYLAASWARGSVASPPFAATRRCCRCCCRSPACAGAKREPSFAARRRGARPRSDVGPEHDAPHRAPERERDQHRGAADVLGALGERMVVERDAVDRRPRRRY